MTVHTFVLNNCNEKVHSITTQILQDSVATDIDMPYLTFGVGASTPALRPQYGPNAQPRLTSWSKESLRGFCRPQDNGPVDTVKLIQRECIVTEDSSPE